MCRKKEEGRLHFTSDFLCALDFPNVSHACLCYCLFFFLLRTQTQNKTDCAQSSSNKCKNYLLKNNILTAH